MKKFSILILTLIMCFLSFSSLIGCNNDSSDNSIVLYDFEDVGRNLYQIEMHTRFGKVSINNDAKYVKEGKTSYKLQPMGYFGTSVKPVLVFPTFSGDYDYSYIDFTKYESVVFDLYSAQSENTTIDVGLTFSKYEFNNKKSWFTGGVEQTFTIEPGWNTIEYKILHDYVNLRADIEYVYGISVAFDNSSSMYIEDSEVFYIDNIKLEKLDVEYKPNTNFNLECDEENGIFEVAYFENSNQKHFFYQTNDEYRWLFADTDVYAPEIEGANGNAFKVKTRRQNGSSDTTFATMLIAKDVMVQAYNNAKANASEGEYEYYLCFDAYNEAKTPYYLWWNFFGSTNELSTLIKNWDRITINPGEWTRFEYNLSKIQVVTGKNSNNIDIKEPYLENIGSPRLFWETYEDEVDRVFLLDNFRIERRAK